MNWKTAKDPRDNRYPIPTQVGWIPIIQNLLRGHPNSFQFNLPPSEGRVKSIIINIELETVGINGLENTGQLLVQDILRIANSQLAYPITHILRIYNDKCRCILPSLIKLSLVFWPAKLGKLVALKFAILYICFLYRKPYQVQITIRITGQKNKASITRKTSLGETKTNSGP